MNSQTSTTKKFSNAVQETTTKHQSGSQSNSNDAELLSAPSEAVRARIGGPTEKSQKKAR